MKLKVNQTLTKMPLKRNKHKKRIKEKKKIAFKKL